MSRPLARVALGVLIGAAGVALLGPHIARRARPAAKAALKAALAAIREARIRGGEIAEAAEDLYAEAKAEAETEAAGARRLSQSPRPRPFLKKSIPLCAFPIDPRKRS